MPNQSIYFRADSGSHIGTGHIMRCLTLADILKDKFEIHFICRAFENHIGKLIEQKGHKLHMLKAGFDKISLDADYREWIGVPLVTELFDVETILAGSNNLIKWLVVDHYSLDKTWHQAMRKFVEKIFVIDDLANREHDCDVLFDHNLKADHFESYRRLYPAACKTLFGPKYALIDESFFAHKKTQEISKVKKALIFLGGIDANDDVNLVVEECLEFDNINFSILPGRMTNMSRLNDLIINKSNFNILKFSKDMAKLYKDSDFCIGSSGVSSLERGVQAIPTIDLLVAENQRNCSEQLELNGLAICLYDKFRLKKGIIRNVVFSFCNEIKQLTNLQKKCLNFFCSKRHDFWGVFCDK